VRQRLGGQAVAGLGPVGLGQWPVGVDADVFPLDVDLGGLFPSAADGLVGNSGIVRGHLGRFVVEQDSDDLLGHVAVETGREQCSNRANAPRWIKGKSIRTAGACSAPRSGSDAAARSCQLQLMQLSDAGCHRIGCNIVTFNATAGSIAWSGCV
jgi:hypothetical protein